jgi:hypothetical protein
MWDRLDNIVGTRGAGLIRVAGGNSNEVSYGPSDLRYLPLREAPFETASKN